MKHIVGVSDMKISDKPDDEIITYSLGSCIGVTVYDPVVRVGGLLHYQLPSSQDSPERASQNPYMYADTGVIALFHAAYRLGASKKRIQIKIAGGSSILDKNDMFMIGHRNYISIKKIFWKNKVFIDAEDIGGNSWRTMRFDIGTGDVWIKTELSENRLEASQYPSVYPGAST